MLVISALVVASFLDCCPLAMTVFLNEQKVVRFSESNILSVHERRCGSARRVEWKG
jgi:hypothetical protein